MHTDYAYTPAWREATLQVVIYLFDLTHTEPANNMLGYIAITRWLINLSTSTPTVQLALL